MDGSYGVVPQDGSLYGRLGELPIVENVYFLHADLCSGLCVCARTLYKERDAAHDHIASSRIET